MSDINELRSKIKNYESQNRIVNPKEFSYINEECDYLRNKLAKYYKNKGFSEFLSAISLFVASILLFFSSTESKNINLQKTEDNPK